MLLRYTGEKMMTNQIKIFPKNKKKNEEIVCSQSRSKYPGKTLATKRQRERERGLHKEKSTTR